MKFSSENILKPKDLSTFGKGQKGFTLIEVMIAMAVMVLAILGVLYLQLSAIKGNSNSITLSRSIQELNTVIDKFGALTYNDSAIDVGTNQTLDTLFNTGTNTEATNLTNNLTGTATYTVTEFTDEALTGDNNPVTVEDGVLALRNDDGVFSRSRAGKQVVVNVVQRVAGVSKTYQLQFLKIDL